MSQTFFDLMDSVTRNELYFDEGGILQFYRKRDGNITLSMIISIKPGSGSRLLNRLLEESRGKKITLRCPDSLPSNRWWREKGFKLVRAETSKKGTLINVYEMEVSYEGPIPRGPGEGSTRSDLPVEERTGSDEGST